ncbi:hypothetical protein J2S09_003962 [Bacillus fengqiuensis]|nr:hypothetical protein [Bacillus fengqiuensis]
MVTIVDAVDRQGDIQNWIDMKREELIHLGINYGFLDKKTIKCSQDLDELINLYIQRQRKILC